MSDRPGFATRALCCCVFRSRLRVTHAPWYRVPDGVTIIRFRYGAARLSMWCIEIDSGIGPEHSKMRSDERA
eukprot:6329514-Prymnesium_polylepis.1